MPDCKEVAFSPYLFDGKSFSRIQIIAGKKDGKGIYYC